MGTLRDEAYENLDYLSQLTEVVIAPQNLVLGRMPDRIELTFEQINNFKNTSWRYRNGFELSIPGILREIARLESNSLHVNDIKQCFKFEVSDDFEIDIANQRMTGTIALVKTIQQLEEKEILKIAVNKANLLMSRYDWPNKRLREKVATVLNIFEQGSGTEWAKKLEGQASYKAEQEIKTAFSSIILENKWRIRDVGVIVKIGEWINSYLSDDGDTDTGLVNLVKLKMMLNKDLPIYSIDEVKNVKPA